MPNSWYHALITAGNSENLNKIALFFTPTVQYVVFFELQYSCWSERSIEHKCHAKPRTAILHIIIPLTLF